VDLIVTSPNAVALNPQQGAAVPAFKAGDIIQAQVLELINDTLAKLGIGNSIIEVQTQVPLTVGTTVRLAVKSTADGIQLTLLGGGNGGSAPASGAPAGAPADDTPPTMNTTGVAAQAAVAASDAAEAATTAQVATGAAGNAATSTAAVTDPLLAAQATQAAPPSPIVVATAALAAAVQSSAARQNGLAPLLADAGVAAGIPTLPEPVRQATERLLALQPTLGETLSADSIKQALNRSGLFLEAHLSEAADGGAADASAAGRAAMAPGPSDDIKAALIVLRSVLKTWLATDAGVGHIGSSPAAATPNPAAAKTAPPLDLHLPLPNGADAGKAAADPRAATPPPPYRGAPTAAQPAAAPSITPDMTPHDIGKVLLNETDAALARQTLLQAASLPNQPGVDPRLDPTNGPRWNFEVPFMTPQGWAVAQFEIARDGRNAPAEGLKPMWRARFSLDVEPIGPVHAQIALIGQRAAVTLWAERPDTSARLRDNAPALADALRQAELEAGDVLVRAGMPPRPAEKVASGRFLDRAS
jgi:hypothetical protein